MDSTPEQHHLLADKITLHGVFLDIADLGLLLLGNAGSGKSELALELITRGHHLIADDAPLLTKTASGNISGSSSALLQDFLEVRGLGILNIRAMFGDRAIKPKKTLRLLVQLIPADEVTTHDNERLEGIIATRDILGISIPEITLPIAPGRNLAVLVEAAARNYLLSINGYNAAADLQSRLEEHLKHRPE
jgi:HPr kinase/phosphorylase